MSIGPIFALDLGRRCGYACGYATDEAPRSGAKTFGDPGIEGSIFGDLIKFLDTEWRLQRPSLVVKEAPIGAGAFRSAPAVTSAAAMHKIVTGMAYLFSVPVLEGHAATIRKFFIGRARTGDRKQTKSAVIERCHQLKLMPRDSFDDDRADAVATWYWARAQQGWRERSLHLFGQVSA